MPKTQHECRDEFLKALGEFAAKIQRIDQETPADPITEPGWWVQMKSIQRSAVVLMDDLAA